jgi:hypothetical protein
MEDIQSKCEEVIKQSKDKEAYYHFGVEFSSDQHYPSYKAYIGFSKEGVGALHFTENSRQKLIQEIDSYLQNPRRIKEVNVRYHESMAEAMDKAKEFHLDMVKSLTKPIKVKKAKKAKKKK